MESTSSDDLHFVGDTGITLLSKKGSDLLPGIAFHSDGGFQSLQQSGMVLLHQTAHLKVEVALHFPAQVVQHSENSYSPKKLASL